MANVCIHLTRNDRADGMTSVSIKIAHRGGSAFIPTGVFVNRESVKFRGLEIVLPNKMDSQRINRKLYDTIHAINVISDTNKIARKSVSEVKELVLDILDPERMPERRDLFYNRFVNYMNRARTQGTREIYAHTLKKLKEFDKRLEDRTFEDIDEKYLRAFEDFLMKTSTSANGRGIKFRNIRAVFNDAIEDGITKEYPFRKKKFRIKQEETRSRAIPIETLRQLKDCERMPYQDKWIDLFFIIFGLIGINMPDLCDLKQIDKDGYIRYKRRKTGKNYCIKVEPEVMALIEKHRGKDHLLDYFDINKDYDQVAKEMGKALKKLNIVDGISAYFARHSWACIALNDAKIAGIEISAALGHKPLDIPSVTQIYARPQQRVIDAANRKVLDLLYFNN